MMKHVQFQIYGEYFSRVIYQKQQLTTNTYKNWFEFLYFKRFVSSIQNVKKKNN